MNLIDELRRLDKLFGINIHEVCSVAVFDVDEPKRIKGWRVATPDTLVIDIVRKTYIFKNVHYNYQYMINTLYNRNFNANTISKMLDISVEQIKLIGGNKNE